MIKEYAIKNDNDDWKRCLVCGVCWLDNSLALNIRQLRLLVDKCKSSINGSLHRMGYTSSTTRGDSTTILVERFPILKGNYQEIRQWTIRQLAFATPQPGAPQFTISSTVLFNPSTPSPGLASKIFLSSYSQPNLSSLLNENESNISYNSEMKDDQVKTLDQFDDTTKANEPSQDNLYDSDPFCLPLNDWSSSLHENDDSNSFLDLKNFSLF